MNLVNVQANAYKRFIQDIKIDGDVKYMLQLYVDMARKNLNIAQIKFKCINVPNIYLIAKYNSSVTSYVYRKQIIQK